MILATILLTNNTVNVAFVLIAARFIHNSLQLGDLSEKIAQITIETLLLLVFGEVIPKIYATANNVEFGMKVSPILLFLKKAFNPLVSGMVKMSNFFDHRFHKQNKNVSIEELSLNVWAYEDSPLSSTVRTYIKNLRKILGEEFILNTRGVGYRFNS